MCSVRKGVSLCTSYHIQQKTRLSIIMVMNAAAALKNKDAAAAPQRRESGTVLSQKPLGEHE